MTAFYAAEGYDPFVSRATQPTLKTRVYRLVRKFTLRRKATRVLYGLLPRSAALDVGCATGELLAHLRKRGFQACGVEPNPEAADYARRHSGAMVWTGGLEALPADVGPFDLIVLWHVLEHMHDLSGSLNLLHSRLTPGGRLAIAVPNPGSADARSYGPRWVAWDAPRHLYHFDPQVMLELLERHGFKPVRQGAVAFDAFYHCLLSEAPTASGLFRAVCRGSRSYLRGLLGGAGSSELYFAYKA